MIGRRPATVGDVSVVAAAGGRTSHPQECGAPHVQPKTPGVIETRVLGTLCPSSAGEALLLQPILIIGRFGANIWGKVEKEHKPKLPPRPKLQRLLHNPAGCAQPGAKPQPLRRGVRVRVRRHSRALQGWGFFFPTDGLHTLAQAVFSESAKVCFGLPTCMFPSLALERDWPPGNVQQIDTREEFLPSCCGR